MKNRIYLLSTVAFTLVHCLSLAIADGQDVSSDFGSDFSSAAIQKYKEDALSRWETAIKALEAKDKVESHPPDSILFVGSSSIRRWQDIAADVAPYHPIQRGYGGAKWSDVAVFADRLVTPHQFRAAVFFVGNDISGRETDKTPEEVARLFAHVLSRVRKHNKTAPVFYIAVTPTPSRFDAWPEIKSANSAVRALCEDRDHAYFIGTESIFLDATGKPEPDLFVADALHLNREGYIRWSAAIKSHLDSVLGGAD